MSNVIFDDRPRTDYGLAGIFWAEQVVASSFEACVSGQENGLLAAGAPGRINWPMASYSGGGRVRIVVHETPPPVDDAYPVVVEVSIVVPPGSEAAVCAFEDALDIPDFPAGTLRVRLSVLHADEASLEDALVEDRTPLDEYRFDIWPQEWSSDQIIRMDSEWARGWHEANFHGPPESARLAEALTPAVRHPTDALVMRRHGLWSGRDVVLWARAQRTDTPPDVIVTRLAALSDAEFHLTDGILAEAAGPAFERSRGRSRDDRRISGLDQRLAVLTAKACLQYDAEPRESLAQLATIIHLDTHPIDPPSMAAELGLLLDRGATERELLAACRRLLAEWDASDPPALVALDALMARPRGPETPMFLPPWEPVLEGFCNRASRSGTVLELTRQEPFLTPVWKAAGLAASPIHTLDLPPRSAAAIHCGLQLDPLDDAELLAAFRTLHTVLRRRGVVLVGLTTPVSDRATFPNFDRREARSHALAHTARLNIVASIADWEEQEPGQFWMLLERR